VTYGTWIRIGYWMYSLTRQPQQATITGTVSSTAFVIGTSRSLESSSGGRLGQLSFLVQLERLRLDMLQVTGEFLWGPTGSTLLPGPTRNT
jgi:hypothetical protein